MKGFEPRFNYYRCPDCHSIFVVVEVDDGVTPMFLACRGIICRGRMHSAMYPPLGAWPAVARRDPDGVYYKPTLPERKKMRRKFPALFQHVSSGGLILRRPDKDTPRFPHHSEQGGPDGHDEEGQQRQEEQLDQEQLDQEPEAAEPAGGGPASGGPQATGPAGGDVAG